MTARALLCGIDSYPGLKGGLSAAELPGGVDAALALYDYLVAQRGVLPADIRLHLAPIGATAAARHPAALGASFAELQASLRALRQGGLGTTEQLFVFFSGHGFRFGSDFGDEPEDVLVCGDFISVEETGHLCVRLSNLQRVLAGLGPGEQYFFIDCCRNRASREALGVGTLGINMNPSQRGGPSQFTLTSTGPDRSAVASAAFINALLDGLAGAGQAKEWYPDDASGRERLEVRFEALYRYVQGRLTSEQHQVPERRAHGGGLGVLKVIDPPPRLFCTIHVAGVAPADSLSAVAWRQSLRAEPIALPGGQGRYELLPGRYTMQVAGEGYVVTPPSQWLPLYEPREVAFTAVAGATPPTGPLESFPDLPTPNSHLPVTVSFSFPGHGQHLHIEDLAGRKITERSGAPERLLPGDYQAVITEAGKRTRIPFAIAVDARRSAPVTVPLRLPEPADATQRALLAAAGTSDGWGAPSEALGPLADRSLSLWLSLLAMMTVTRYQGHLATRVGLPALVRGAGEATLLVLCAAEQAPAARVLATAGDVLLLLEKHTAVPGLWFGALGLRPGAHVLELQLGEAVLLLPLHLQPGRVSTVVRVQRPELPATLNHYLLPDGPERPELAGVHPLVAMKRLEAAQHAYESGLPLPDESGDGDLRDVDPLTECQRAYSLMRGGQALEAQAAVQRLLGRYPDLPDLPALARLTDLPPPPPAPGAPLLSEGLLTLAPTGHLAGYPDPALLDLCSPFTCWRR